MPSIAVCETELTSLARQAGPAQTGMLPAACHGQALDAPPRAQVVADEVHDPHLIDRRGQSSRHAFVGGAFDLLALVHRLDGGTVQAVDVLVVRAQEVRAQDVADAPLLDEAERAMGDLDAIFLVPMDVGVDFMDELVDRGPSNRCDAVRGARKQEAM
ncbi:hypothetical protein ACSFBX_30505 [Variovorax sp. RB2P76]|uniref:hypothetical protein n=1 Tax=Variovorax sp. RB2P76 TaxID=3443736 RepID=UPI003F4886E4